MGTPCNCCGEPPCNAPTLQFISIEAECTVCGFALPIISEFVEGESEAIPPAEDRCLRFATRTDTYSDDTSYDGPYPDPLTSTDTFTYENHRSQTDVSQKLLSEEGMCESRYLSGAYSFSESRKFGPTGGALTQDTLYAESAMAGNDGVFSGSWSYTDNINSGNNDSGATSGQIPLTIQTPDSSWDYSSPGIYSLSYVTDPGLPANEVTWSLVITFSDPVTTCEPKLPEWPAWEGESEDELEAGQGYEDSAANEKSGECDLTLRLRSIKWRLTHPPSGTCYLKAWLRKTFTPAVGDPVETDLPPYEWVGTGSPCFTNAAVPAGHADNIIHGTETEEAYPEEEGVTTIEVTKFSCVSGYEPDISDPENPQPNGFPDPLWEAEPP